MLNLVINFFVVAIFFTVGILFGEFCAVVTDREFYKSSLNFITGIAVMVMAIMFDMGLSVINAHLFFVFIGVIIGYPYFCRPAQWFYGDSKYHKL